MKLNVLSIRVLMAEKELSQSELANKLGIGKQYVSVILSRGTCTTVTAGKIAKALETSVSDIVLEG